MAKCSACKATIGAIGYRATDGSFIHTGFNIPGYSSVDRVKVTPAGKTCAYCAGESEVLVKSLSQWAY